jgi:hypothetical protein
MARFYTRPGQNIAEETNGSVIVVSDASDEFQSRHLHVS